MAQRIDPQVMAALLRTKEVYCDHLVAELELMSGKNIILRTKNRNLRQAVRHLVCFWSPFSLLQATTSPGSAGADDKEFP